MRKIRKRGFSGTADCAISDRERASAQVAYEVACESFVLLKNDGVLPLDIGKPVALYGRGAAKTIKGGTGSGDVNERKSITIYEGMLNAGFNITTRDWLDDYVNQYDRARNEWKKTIFTKIEEMQNAAGHEIDSRDGNEFFIAYTTTPFVAPMGSEPKTNSADTAIYVISRVAGEGADRYLEKGDYYLSDEEEAFIEKLCSLHKKVVLVINAGGVIDLSLLDKEWAVNIGAVLLISQPGQEGGHAFADVISGKISPSGKLTDTWTLKYEDIPFANEFAHLNGNLDYEEYKEDIYVGYRYFDTVGKPVRYCFGHGLSYTDFDVSIIQCRVVYNNDNNKEKELCKHKELTKISKELYSDGKEYTNSISASCDNSAYGYSSGIHIEVDITVKNVGTYTGKEVVQLYVSLPQNSKTMTKEFRRLIAYAKTKELVPGESQKLSLNIQPEYLTSFDEEKSAYVLDSGVYGIWVGSSLDNAVLKGAVVIYDSECNKENTVSVTCKKESDCNNEIYKVDHICALDKGFEKLELMDTISDSRYKMVENYVNRNAQHEINVNTDGKKPTSNSYTLETIAKLDLADLQHFSIDYSDNLYHGADEIDIREIKEAEEFVKSLTLEECCLLAMGDPTKQHNGVLGAAGSTVPGSAGETNHIAEEKGLAGMPLADGPAGLRLLKKYKVHDGKVQYTPFMAALENGFFYDEPKQEGETYYQYCTAFPVDVSMAQTWNDCLVAKAGKAVATEMEELGITLWLAPGMNIHRNPLCGRNFEYYSEDPFLSGKIAAAMTRGVQSISGVGTTIKHFCCNNSEDNRFNSDSRVTERALREIYLRGFEIAVKESQPMAIMTSYNLVNGVHTANNYDLCTKVARNEWGFKGLIMTDWATTIDGKKCVAANCIKAGNDLIMPGMQEDLDSIKEELAAGTLTEEQLRACITRLVRVIFKSNQYEK